MPKVMLLDHELNDIIVLEDILQEAGYQVCSLTGPYGILAKFDYEKPDILLFNPDMPNTDTDAILSTLMNAATMQNMVIILICTGDPEPIEQYCRQMNLHGYYMKDNGMQDIVEYLSNFLEES